MDTESKTPVTDSLVAATKAHLEATEVLSRVEWTLIPQVFAELSAQLSPKQAEVIIATNVSSFESIVETRKILSAKGDQLARCKFSKKVARDMCSELVNWTGQWLVLRDTVTRLEQ